MKADATQGKQLRRAVEAANAGMVVIAGPFWVYDEAGAESEKRACLAARAAQTLAGVKARVVRFGQAAWVMRDAVGMMDDKRRNRESYKTPGRIRNDIRGRAGA